MFKFDENDRDKKELKKNFKKIEKEHKGKVKFRHLIGINNFLFNHSKTKIDFYLTSSEDYTDCMKSIDASAILDSLEPEEDRFNEKLLRLLCVN
jgi:hypothetical protein